MTKKINENMDNNKAKVSVADNKLPKYKTEKCRVLSHNSKTKELDVDFKGYGIRLSNVKNVDSNYVDIKYIGEIGKPNFSCKL